MWSTVFIVVCGFMVSCFQWFMVSCVQKIVAKKNGCQQMPLNHINHLASSAHKIHPISFSQSTGSVSFECLTQAKQSTRLQLKLEAPNTHSTQTQRYLAQLLPALLQLTQLGLQHLSTLAITKKHAAATNFTPEQTKMCVWDRQSLIIDGWRRLDTKDAGRTLKECNRWFPKTGSKMT